MASLRIVWLLMCTFCTISYSIPIQTRKSTVQSQSEKNSTEKSTVNKTTGAQPMIVFMEETNSKAGSVFIEFVYNNKDFKPSDNEKYNIVPIPSEKSSSRVQEINDAAEKLRERENSFKKKMEIVEMMKSKMNHKISSKMNDKAKNDMALKKKEFSPNIQKRPYYKKHVMELPKQSRELTYRQDIPVLTEAINQYPFVAGPVLYPISMFEKELEVPFF